jgi:hypothetical protein
VPIGSAKIQLGERILLVLGGINPSAGAPTTI